MKLSHGTCRRRVNWQGQKRAEVGYLERSLRTVLLKLLIHVLHVRNGFFGKLKAIYCCAL